MTTQTNKMIVLRFLTEVWEKGNLDSLGEMVADAHIHHLSRRDVHGPAGVRLLVAGFRAFLPEVEIAIHEILVDEDKVVAYFTFSGTDTGGYMGHPPSGKQVVFSGIDIFRLAEGKIVERWGILDSASLLYQIGAMA
ncbi:MAG: ester cyclase [Oligoflexia bacterium]|nr:ester cyclase [Oligoflexia bacterium]